MQKLFRSFKGLRFFPVEKPLYFIDLIPDHIVAGQQMKALFVAFQRMGSALEHIIGTLAGNVQFLPDFAQGQVHIEIHFHTAPLFLRKQRPVQIEEPSLADYIFKHGFTAFQTAYFGIITESSLSVKYFYLSGVRRGRPKGGPQVAGRASWMALNLVPSAKNYKLQTTNYYGTMDTRTS